MFGTYSTEDLQISGSPVLCSKWSKGSKNHQLDHGLGNSEESSNIYIASTLPLGGGQEEKGAAEDEMVGCHHELNGHEFQQTLGDSERQGSLASMGYKELNMTQ